MYGRHSGLFGSSLGLGIFKSCAAAAHAAPEGYTVSIGNTSAVHPVQYDVLKDFEAVSLLINGPTCAAVATWPSSRLPCAILVQLEAPEVPDNVSIQDDSGLSQGLVRCSAAS